MIGLIKNFTKKRKREKKKLHKSSTLVCHVSNVKLLVFRHYFKVGFIERERARVRHTWVCNKIRSLGPTQIIQIKNI